MFDNSIEFDCEECGGIGPPPKFMIPPPPRPIFMQELLKCRDNDEINSSSYISSSSNRKSSSNNIFYSNSDINLDNSDMCEAIPILDASYHSSPSLQTSAMIAVFSLLLVLVILISSLFVWKHKRKVQNFLPCKTTARGPHIGSVTSGHSVTYEDPDAPLGHRPLMMGHHHNVEMLSKSVHYPSGYPMTRSPPHLVCNSPGPDPYRSNDNVYEELDPARGSDNESEGVGSDDDFAEDELSLPGERNLNKLSPENKIVNGQVSTIYHEQCTSNQPSNINERNTLLSSSSSSYIPTNSHLHNTNNITTENNSNSSFSTTNRLGILSGVFRNSTGRNNKKNLCNNNMQQNNRTRCQNHKTLPHNQEELNRSALVEQSSRHPNLNILQSDVVIPSTQYIYDDAASRNSLMQLAYNHNNNNNNNNNNFLTTLNSSNINNTNRINNNLYSQHCYNTLDSEVERRNRINQLHHTPESIPPVATIFRGTGSERINYNSSRYPQPYYTSQPNGILSIQQRSKTNPRSIDRRRVFSTNVAATNVDESNYGYAEPVFHEGLMYGISSNNNVLNNTSILRPAYPPYAVPDYTISGITINSNGPFRTLGNYHNHHTFCNNNSNNQEQQQHYYHPHDTSQFYSRDSSFGSDSGYSHQTSSSNGNNRNNCPNYTPQNNIIGGQSIESDTRTPTPSVTPTNLSLPSSDSGCTTTNGPSSLNSMKLSQKLNCDKENSNFNNSNNIPFGWARTRTANLNSNYKKYKDNKSATAFSLDLIGGSNLINIITSSPKMTERINNSGIARTANTNSLEIDCEIGQNMQTDNQKANLNNNFNNCLTSSPNNNTNNSNIINNNINNNSINNICSDINETNRTVNNSDSSNSFNIINNNSTNSNSCKSQS